MILVNNEHLAADTPFRSSYAIYVREGERTFDETDRVPEMLRSRLLSLRAFDAQGMLLDADVVDGAGIEVLIDRLFADARAAYIHAHFAKPGCYAALVQRA